LFNDQVDVAIDTTPGNCHDSSRTIDLGAEVDSRDRHPTAVEIWCDSDEAPSKDCPGAFTVEISPDGAQWEQVFEVHGLAFADFPKGGEFSDKAYHRFDF
jgi:hypothetical protein